MFSLKLEFVPPVFYGRIVSMEERKLYQRISSLAQKTRFHMPGHKGRGEFLRVAPEYLDVTEIPGSDDLHHAEEIIAEAEAALAKAYGSEGAKILVGGSTAGIQAAILGCARPGEKFLVPANCHKSVFAALAIGGIEPILIEPRIDGKLKAAIEIVPEMVEEALRDHPQARGMILVNPTYYGTTSDVARIAEILHERGKVLVVDEAHGAHLRFAEDYPPDGISAGADVVIQSTHKILGSLTQSSLIHYQGELAPWPRIKSFLAMLQSSSPSYILMMSVEAAVAEAQEKAGTRFRMVAKAWDEWQEKGFGSISLYGRPNYDKSKWLFHIPDGQGFTVFDRLVDEHDIVCELATADYILAMTGIGTTQGDLDRLTTAMTAIGRELEVGEHEVDATAYEAPAWEREFAYSLREVIFSAVTREVPLGESVGCVSGGFLTPYPPGIPLVYPGEVIRAERVAELAAMLAAGAEVQGVNEQGQIMIVDEMRSEGGRNEG